MPDTIEAMMKEAMGRLGVDFPLADFLTDAPSKSFLSGVTAGEVVNTMPIDGIPCLHMFFPSHPASSSNCGWKRTISLCRVG